MYQDVSNDICRIINDSKVWLSTVVIPDWDQVLDISSAAVIESMNEFKQSKVMLCTFHAIWMPFKKDLIPLLNDCEHGKIVGECWET